MVSGILLSDFLSKNILQSIKAKNKSKYFDLKAIQYVNIKRGANTHSFLF